MGYLLNDNRVSGGEVLEMDTIACCHCRAVIRIVIKGCTKAYETPFNCEHCKKPICRYCAEVLLGACPGDYMSVVEHAERTGIWEPRTYQYGQIVATGMKLPA